MSKIIKIVCTAVGSSTEGSFTVYYDTTVSPTLVVGVNGCDVMLNNVTAQQLLTGVTIVAPDNVSTLYIYNNSGVCIGRYTSINIPGVSPTPTPSASPAPTVSPTTSVTPTITPTTSVTPTITSTVTPTVTPTITPTNSVTPTVTQTITPTTTPSITTSNSVTPTVTSTVTPTVTPSITITATPTTTPSITTSTSVTPTVTTSVTPTVTPSITTSNSVTPTVTPSITTSNSVTPTVTPSITTSNSVTPSITVSTSVTPTVTPSITTSNSVTPTVTPSITTSNSVTPTVTPTITPTNSVTPTITPSVTRTPSITPTVTVTPSTSRIPITLSTSPSCAGGANTGIIYASSFSGGTNSYVYIAISNVSSTDALNRLDNAGTRNDIGAGIDYTYTSLSNGTYFVAISDSAGNKGVSSSNLISCFDPSPSPTRTPSLTPTRTPSLTPTPTVTTTPSVTPSQSCIPNYSSAIGTLYLCNVPGGGVNSYTVFQNTNGCWTGNQFFANGTSYATNPSNSAPDTTQNWQQNGANYCSGVDLYQPQIQTNPCAVNYNGTRDQLIEANSNTCAEVYVLTNCLDNSTGYSIVYVKNTFAVNDRVTSSGVTYVIASKTTTNLAGSLALTSTGLTGCPQFTQFFDRCNSVYYYISGTGLSGEGTSTEVPGGCLTVQGVTASPTGTQIFDWTSDPACECV